METIRDELVEKEIKEDHVIYLNVEDMDYAYIEGAADLHTDIKRRIADSLKYYILLDEIQHVRDFEKALSSFRATLNVSFFITGSNSTLLKSS